MKVNKSLERLKVKIDLVPLDKKLINDKLFKGKDPNEKQLENVQIFPGQKIILILPKE